VATLRNSRGGDYPSVLDAVRTCVAAGARGITVHPRSDERHIRRSDVHAIAALLAKLDPAVELNIEGDPRADWIELVSATRPAQATLVPVRPGETTSEAGWSERTDLGSMREIVRALKAAGARISMFVDPEPAPIAWAKDVGADRVELYTEPFARAFAQGDEAGRESFDRYRRAAEEAHRLGLGVNAGHDLDLNNLIMFRELPHLDEVSIGHALIGRALFAGLSTVVREYLDCLRRRS
ncbi:MAG TPA: pyridoxine 5'-phosphate synthase, partial [Polyangiales bacterium]